MYKTTVFIIVIISLSIVTVGASLIWDKGFKRSSPSVDLQNNISSDSLTTAPWPEYKRPSDGGQRKIGQGVEKLVAGNEIQRSGSSSSHSISNDVGFDTSPASESNSYGSQSSDVDEMQESIASFMDQHIVNSMSLGRRGGRGGGSSGPSPGTNSSGGSSGSSSATNSDGGVDLPKDSRLYLSESIDEFDIYDSSQENALGQSSSSTPVPEPATMLLFGAGLAGLAGYRLRRKKS